MVLDTILWFDIVLRNYRSNSSLSIYYFCLGRYTHDFVFNQDTIYLTLVFFLLSRVTRVVQRFLHIAVMDNHFASSQNRPSHLFLHFSIVAPTPNVHMPRGCNPKWVHLWLLCIVLIQGSPRFWGQKWGKVGARSQIELVMSWLLYGDAKDVLGRRNLLCLDRDGAGLLVLEVVCCFLIFGLSFAVCTWGF